MSILIKSNDSVNRKEKIFDLLGRGIIAIFAFFLLARAFIGPVWHSEIDSNALPVISLQYRSSFLIDETDIQHAQQDFPSLYRGISHYEDLRASRLIKVTETEWLPYYFPIYPFFCMPLKLFFRVIGVTEERTFFVTNAALISCSLWYLQRRLKVSAKQRLFAVILLILSPITYYNNYINYEAFVFSLLTISLVMYYNKSYKSSAFFLSLAGMSNSTVMAIGLVMIGEYFIRILIRNKAKSIGRFIKENIRETILYGACFLPCLAPFVLQFFYLRGNAFIESAGLNHWGEIFLEYLFDPSLGFPSFAPVALLAFFVLAFKSIVKRNFSAVPWLLFLLTTVSAYSLMPHINCGMIYCSRYIPWTYPIIPVFLATVGYDTISFPIFKRLLYIISAAMAIVLLYINDPTALNPLTFNQETVWLLDNFPSIYNPYSATFYCRTLHQDGAYVHTEPAYYESTDGYVRKLIFQASPGQRELVLDSLIGDEDSMNYLKSELEKAGEDGKFHYVNFSRLGKYRLEKKPEKLELNREIYFDASEDDAHRYFVSGMSGTETDFAWTNGDKTLFRAFISDEVIDDLEMRINLKRVFYPPQQVVITCDDLVLFDEIIESTAPIVVSIPKECVSNQCLELQMKFPNAISPAEISGSTDKRKLAIGITSLSLKKQPERLEVNKEIYFDASEDDAHSYFISGMSGTETDFAWTNGDEALFRGFIPDEIIDDFELKINLKRVFNPPQQVVITCDDLVLFDEIIESTAPIVVSIPKECVSNQCLELQMKFPDAISPAEVSESRDGRKLAIGITSFSIQ